MGFSRANRFQADVLSLLRGRVYGHDVRAEWAPLEHSPGGTFHARRHSVAALGQPRESGTPSEVHVETGFDTFTRPCIRICATIVESRMDDPMIMLRIIARPHKELRRQSSLESSTSNDAS